MNIEKAAKELFELSLEGVLDVLIIDDVVKALVCYVQKKKHALLIPKKFKGFSVITRVVGGVKILKRKIK